MSVDLHDRSISHCRCEAGVIESEHLDGEQAEGLQFLPVDIVPVVLGKAVDEEGFLLSPEQHDATIPARPSLTLPGNALLDDIAAKIGIDQTCLGAADGLAKRRVVDILLRRETGKGS
jgi:hypothetical protein